MFRLDRLLGAWGVAGLTSVAMIPFVFSVGPKLETALFPVTSVAEIHEVTQTDEGVSFYVSFDKVRSCEFLGVAWYEGAVRVGIEFEPGHQLYPQTRPEGDQYAGPWLVRGVSSLDRTNAVAMHRCNPLWLTTSTFYVGAAIGSSPVETGEAGGPHDE